MAGPLYGGALPGIIIPTSVQFAADMLRYWSSMTCLYDPMWVAEPGRSTLPISMFHITSMEEIGTTEVSKKRVILYEPQSANTTKDNANVVRPSVLRAITDNAVKMPKVYQINAILPFTPLGRYVRDGAQILFDTIALFTTTLSNRLYAGDTLPNIMLTANFTASLLLSAYDTLLKLPSMNDLTYVNKNSLEAMWDNTHFLCMKMWTGYDYKYVMITNIKFTKQAKEDDVFRVVMELQEMPVLTVTRPKQVRGGDVNVSKLAAIVSRTNTALSKSLTSIMGVPDEVRIK